MCAYMYRDTHLFVCTYTYVLYRYICIYVCVFSGRSFELQNNKNPLIIQIVKNVFKNTKVKKKEAKKTRLKILLMDFF